MQLRHSSARVNQYLAIAAIMLVGFNLRPMLASIGPLLEQIQNDTAMNNTVASLLTSLPIFLMGVLALTAKPILNKFGTYHGIIIGLVAIVLGCIMRWPWHLSAGLIISSSIAGIGIGLIQALMPAFIKDNFASRADSLLGFFGTSIMAGAAITAFYIVDISLNIGWTTALVLLAVPSIFALVLWRSVKPDRNTRPAAIQDSPSVTDQLWKNKRAWLLLIFFGVGTANYTLILAWFSPFYVNLGFSAATSGVFLASLTLCEVFAGLLVSVLVNHVKDIRILLLASLACIIAGLILLISAPVALLYLTIFLLGLGIGSLFPLSLILTLQHSSSAKQASALLGFVQGGGYMIAALMPFVAGMINDYFKHLNFAWLIMLISCLILLVLSLKLKPAKVI